MKFLATCLGLVLLLGTSCNKSVSEAAPVITSIRVASFNIEDVRTEDVISRTNPRLKKVAAILQQLRPDIVLLKELAYDQPGAPFYPAGTEPGQNGQRLADNYLALPQGEGLAPLLYKAYMAPSNTGIASGFDLDRNGEAVSTYPDPPGADENGKPGRQTAGGRSYGGDSWGFGTFPGQYAMTLLVRSDFEILDEQVRTFQLLPWSKMPGALLPTIPETDEFWYAGEAGKRFRLSSKNHLDIPVRVGSQVVHFLCSHPTPPAFDGPEARNKKRNHDEIRFWADYLNNAAYIMDDNGRSGGLKGDPPVIILGDLNADPEKGSSVNNPIGNFLLSHPRIRGEFVPYTPAKTTGERTSKTAVWGLRVDYVLPSTDFVITDGGIFQYETDRDKLVSDHYPVWLDLRLPQ